MDKFKEGDYVYTHKPFFSVDKSVGRASQLNDYYGEITGFLAGVRDGRGIVVRFLNGKKTIRSINDLRKVPKEEYSEVALRCQALKSLV